MNFTLSWLKKFLKTEATLQDIVTRLNEIGFEVDQVIDNSITLKDFIIAEIIDIEKPTFASKLSICKVFDGVNVLQIVCGADNVKKGLKVVLAPIGSIIPANNLKIKLSKIQNIESHGMLCSASELMLETESQGIIELDANASVGEKFIDYNNLYDPVIKIEITPNRGDCLGVYGIARELAAAGIGELISITPKKLPNQTANFQVEIENNFDCKSYFATVIENIQNHITPNWLQNYLRAIGLESISVPVDIANYIMYSYGQPQHIYDFDKVRGMIKIRKAKNNEKIVTLDGKTYCLTENDLVISDEIKILALAGIIGSIDSAYNSSTQNILLETAIFDHDLIILSGRHHIIDTQAKYRFERKVDPAFSIIAHSLAVQMILEICGGTIIKETVYNTSYKERSLLFNFQDLKSIGGINIEKEVCFSILDRLGFKLSLSENQNYNLLIPSWRHDINIPEDIVEEILRIYGYNNILSTNFVEQNVINSARSINPLNKLRILSAELGYDEVVSWSFMDKKFAAQFHDIEDKLEITNPISNELNYLRPSIIPNLLQIIKKNQARGLDDLSLFEIGPIFKTSLVKTNFEQSTITTILTGYNTRNNIHGNSIEYDSYDIKFFIEEILNLYGYQLSNLNTSEEALKYFHPQRSQVIYLNREIIGFYGEIHPAILKTLEIKKRVIAAEIFIDKIPYKPKKNKISFSNFQSVERDFAFIIPAYLKSGEILKIIYKVDGLIKNAEVFDVYQEKNLAQNQKSIAIRVTILSENKTLDEDDIKKIHNNIILKVSEFGAQLR